MADGGTIFLDEISEMPLELQSKLLLVVEHGSFRRVGGARERQVRVRVIAASNQDLEERARAGAFRRDLFYRLNAFVVHIPPLRQREGDALRIAEVSLERLTRRYARPGMRFTDAACAAIASHDWPGNVRELVNSVQRAVMLCDGPEIHASDLGIATAAPFEFLPAPADHEPSPAAAGNGDGPRPGRLAFDFEHGPYRAEDVERELIMQALKHTHGNVSRAAKLIGMQRSSLRYRIERYRLESFVAEVSNR
jgi:DNA-binding NtrC family response regulator